MAASRETAAKRWRELAAAACQPEIEKLAWRRAMAISAASVPPLGLPQSASSPGFIWHPWLA